MVRREDGHALRRAFYLELEGQREAKDDMKEAG